MDRLIRIRERERERISYLTAYIPQLQRYLTISCVIDDDVVNDDDDG